MSETLQVTLVLPICLLLVLLLFLRSFPAYNQTAAEAASEVLDRAREKRTGEIYRVYRAPKSSPALESNPDALADFMSFAQDMRRVMRPQHGR